MPAAPSDLSATRKLSPAPEIQMKAARSSWNCLLASLDWLVPGAQSETLSLAVPAASPSTTSPPAVPGTTAGWIDGHLNRLWRARGTFPGRGSALTAFDYEWGFQHGSPLGYEIERACKREGDGGSPSELVDAVAEDPARPDSRRGWILPLRLTPTSMCSSQHRFA